MTGPEHYEIAQDLIFAQTKPDAMNPKVRILREAVDSDVIAVAQVHATLAGVYAHNRATTELTGLLHAMLDQIRELREAHDQAAADQDEMQEAALEVEGQS